MTTLVTVRFSQGVTYDDHSGVTIVHDNGGSFTITGTPLTPSGSNILAYEGDWDIPVGIPDGVNYDYNDGLGNYRDGDSVPMESVNIEIVNCTDLSGAVEFNGEPVFFNGEPVVHF